MLGTIFSRLEMTEAEQHLFNILLEIIPMDERQRMNRLTSLSEFDHAMLDSIAQHLSKKRGIGIYSAKRARESSESISYVSQEFSRPSSLAWVEQLEHASSRP